MPPSVNDRTFINVGEFNRIPIIFVANTVERNLEFLGLSHFELDPPGIRFFSEGEFQRCRHSTKIEDQLPGYFARVNRQIRLVAVCEGQRITEDGLAECSPRYAFPVIITEQKVVVLFVGLDRFQVLETRPLLDPFDDFVGVG